MEGESIKFLEGERILAVPEEPRFNPDVPPEERVIKTYVGTVVKTSAGKHSDRCPCKNSFYVEWEDKDQISSVDWNFPPTLPCFTHYNMKRLAPLEATFPELGDRFEEVLDSKYDSIRELAKRGKGTKRATALATLRNLERFLKKD